MNQQLTGVPETLLIPLWARAVETEKEQPIIRDPKAMEMVARIDYDFSKFEKVWLSQLGVAIRTMLLDKETGNYLQLNPGAVVINLGAGLDTRAERFKDQVHCWYDLDLPEVIELRRQFFSEDERHKLIAASAFDFSWLDQVDCGDKPVLLLSEGMLMYFDEREVRKLFLELAARLPGSEMLFEALAPLGVGRSKHHDAVSKMESAAEFKWGPKDCREVESWTSGIQYIEEWNYFDYHKDRWKWFGRIARLPLLKPKFSNRIVHVKFTLDS
ncbi:class I SAM-dependent methyltransferase [Desulfobulbus rhabdoformis]|uniref:class I SAM-dependent methyltransferase n=1 Tax=Desulfobulbus rhabdoformis TaxID=34032 RepID=UPI001964DBEE|nr:class I SAM-dependent methyltransferase [Desulfobulbus rhabdoformis]MBM9616325.1 class I SAM-dependent methyltransferase [Desulfobulbus rhabdoformis]